MIEHITIKGEFSLAQGLRLNTKSRSRTFLEQIEELIKQICKQDSESDRAVSANFPVLGRQILARAQCNNQEVLRFEVPLKGERLSFQENVRLWRKTPLFGFLFVVFVPITF